MLSHIASGIYDRLGQQPKQDLVKIHCELLRNCLKGQFSTAEKQHRFSLEKDKKWLCKQN